MARQRRDDGGSVTAETALALPAVVLVLAVLLSVNQVVSAQVRCVDAARAAARLGARGESSARVLAVAGAAAPDGAKVAVSSGGGAVRVDVHAVVGLSLPGLPSVPVDAHAVADLEQP